MLDALPQEPPAIQAAASPAASYDEQYARARSLAANGQPELALAAWNALLARSPGNADVLLGRGQSYARLKRYAEAEADLRTAATAAPAYADVWAALGDIYSWSGRPALAIDAYTHVIALQPNDPAHRIARAAAYRDSGDAAKARADLDAAAALGGDAQRIAAVAPPAAQPTAPAPLAAVSASSAPRTATPEAQAPAGYTWAAGASASATRVSLRDQRWYEQNLSVRRYFARGSLGVEALRADRFGRHDLAWALDGYASLWDGAYANLRYQHAPDERLFPRYSWRAELFQAVGAGWELAASDDRLQFGAAGTDIYGVAVARYVGDFYIRLRHTRIVAPDGHSNGDRLVVRYYYRGDGDNYVEGAASRGRSDDTLALSGGRLVSDNASLAYVRYLSPRWGVKLGLSYARDAATGAERGLSAGLTMRW
jgi:YaiO family outer membrane protein